MPRMPERLEFFHLRPLVGFLFIFDFLECWTADTATVLTAWRIFCRKITPKKSRLSSSAQVANSKLNWQKWVELRDRRCGSVVLLKIMLSYL